MQKMMKAGVLAGPGKIVVKEVAAPEMRPGMIEVKVSACGVCGSDVHMWKAGRGWYEGDREDFVMGHEFCGVITDPGDSDFQIGDRVVFWANLYCGECDMCKAGLEHLCRDVNGTNYIGFVCNGGYAETFVGPAKNAYKLPDTVSDVAAALIDPLMVAYHAVKHSDIRLHSKVLVSGSGIIGHMIGCLAKRAGAAYVAMSKVNDLKIEKAKACGAFDAFFDGNDPEAEKKMLEATEGGFDVAFEAVGADAALQTCVSSVKPGGEVVMIGNSMDPTVAFSMNQAVLHEVRLHGSVSCTRQEFEETIDLIARGMIVPEQFATDILPLEQLQEAFERLTTESDPILKAVVKPGL
ncbi:MAG: alcohol dehydrogenase catalytic domain-containing protein [Eubacteriales bacterium]|nr:alcohol dehydrogenase catalytic domain-containing protein [Eubacteriales bacterium]